MQIGAGPLQVQEPANVLSPSMPELETSQPGSPVVRILAGKLFDPYSGKLLENKIIAVSPHSGLILSVDSFDPCDHAARSLLDGSDIIDLQNYTVLPGFVDAHVHCKFTRFQLVFQVLFEMTNSVI